MKINQRLTVVLVSIWEETLNLTWWLWMTGQALHTHSKVNTQWAAFVSTNQSFTPFKIFHFIMRPRLIVKLGCTFHVCSSLSDKPRTSCLHGTGYQCHRSPQTLISGRTWDGPEKQRYIGVKDLHEYLCRDFLPEHCQGAVIIALSVRAFVTARPVQCMFASVQAYGPLFTCMIACTVV